MKQKLIKTLNELGLDEKEARVYFSALSLGPSTVLSLARDSALKRTTIYNIIETLKQRGLISVEIRGWKKLFAAESPKKLEQLLEKKEQGLKEALPDFLSLYNFKGDESTIKYFEGLEAVKSVYLSLLENIRPHENYSVIADQEKWQRLDENFFKGFIEKRGKLNINLRLLLEESPSALENFKFQKNYNEQIKILPKNSVFSANLIVTPQKAVIHQLVPPVMAIVIENKNIIKMYQEIFNLLWDRVE